MSAQPTTPTLPLPEAFRPLAAELATYWRELPRLLEEREAGRYAVVGEGIVTLWDTYADALQYGYERFGERTFLAQRIDPRDLIVLAPYFPPVADPTPNG